MEVVRWIWAVLMAAFAATAVAACGATESDENEITFSKTIEPLVQEKCQRCHREGGIAPFALVSYRDVQRIGNLAKEKVVAREMPPWGAFDDDTCKVQHEFRDNLSLTQGPAST